MNRVKLIIKYIDQICQAIDAESEIFDKRIHLILTGEYGTQEFQKIEHELEKIETKVKNLLQQASKIV